MQSRTSYAQMPARRTNITLPESLFVVAEENMSKQHFTSFSEYVAQLIRDDASSRPILNDAPALDPPRHAHTVSYRGGKKRAS